MDDLKKLMQKHRTTKIKSKSAAIGNDIFSTGGGDCKCRCRCNKPGRCT